MPARRPYRRRRRKAGRMQVYKAAGKQLYRDVRSLKRLINVEFKFLDTQLNVSAQTTTPMITQLSNIAQGDTTMTRDGSQIKCLSIQLSYFMTMHTSAVGSIARVLLIKDKQTNQAIYSAGDVLTDITAFDGIVSPYNRDNRKRFTIMYDKIHTFTNDGTEVRHAGRRFRQDQILRYDANAGTIADLTQASYSLMTFSSEATNSPQITAFVRLNFVDN